MPIGETGQPKEDGKDGKGCVIALPGCSSGVAWSGFRFLVVLEAPQAPNHMPGSGGVPPPALLRPLPMPPGLAEVVLLVLMP